MSAFPITFIVSACLLAIFIIYFARTHSGQRKRGVDQESLLPLEEETPRVVGSPESKAVQQDADGSATHKAATHSTEGEPLPADDSRAQQTGKSDPPKHANDSR